MIGRPGLTFVRALLADDNTKLALVNDLAAIGFRPANDLPMGEKGTGGP
jgi:hypothetical protein